MNINRRSMLLGSSALAGVLAIPSICAASEPLTLEQFADVLTEVGAAPKWSPVQRAVLRMADGNDATDLLAGSRARIHRYGAPHGRPGIVVLNTGIRAGRHIMSAVVAMHAMTRGDVPVRVYANGDARQVEEFALRMLRRSRFVQARTDERAIRAAMGPAMSDHHGTLIYTNHQTWSMPTERGWLFRVGATTLQIDVSSRDMNPALPECFDDNA